MSLPEVCVVLLLRRGPHGVEVLLGETHADDGRCTVVGIGAALEPGEPADQAAVRGVRDQIGVEVEASDLHPAGVVDRHFPTQRGRAERSTVFACRRWQGEPVLIAGLAPRWFLLDAVPYARMGDDFSRWLPGVLRGGTVDARFTFGADLTTVVLSAE